MQAETDFQISSQQCYLITDEEDPYTRHWLPRDSPPLGQYAVCDGVPYVSYYSFSHIHMNNRHCSSKASLGDSSTSVWLSCCSAFWHSLEINIICYCPTLQLHESYMILQTQSLFHWSENNMSLKPCHKHSWSSSLHHSNLSKSYLLHSEVA